MSCDCILINYLILKEIKKTNSTSISIDKKALQSVLE